MAQVHDLILFSICRAGTFQLAGWTLRTTRVRFWLSGARHDRMGNGSHQCKVTQCECTVTGDGQRHAYAGVTYAGALVST